jgi:hypothetical protein
MFFLCLSYIGLTQATDFSPFVGHFSAQPGGKMTYKRKKYNAAAGSTRFCESPTYDESKRAKRTGEHVRIHTTCANHTKAQRRPVAQHNAQARPDDTQNTQSCSASWLKQRKESGGAIGGDTERWEDHRAQLLGGRA